jgi:glc operon protein GlcG
MGGETMRTILAAGAVAYSAAALAQAPAQRITADTAQAIVAGCLARDGTANQSHAIAVTDTGGHLVAALRAERSSAGAMEFAIAKARAAAIWGFATSGMEEGARSTPGFANAPHVVTVPGGVPVYSADGTARLGAVGASGTAPADDVACAVAGIEAAGLRSSPAPR